MATKIRLQRHGRKSYAFYSIVIADVRAPRDGKFRKSGSSISFSIFYRKSYLPKKLRVNESS